MPAVERSITAIALFLLVLIAIKKHLIGAIAV
jgi:hypothetical protein